MDGADSLREGTDEFKEKSKDMDGQIHEEIDGVVDSFSGSDFVPVSFVSDKNKNVELVQFVMKTAGIQIPEPEEIPVEEEPEGFWKRLAALFG